MKLQPVLIILGGFVSGLLVYLLTQGEIGSTVIAALIIAGALFAIFDAYQMKNEK